MYECMDISPETVASGGSNQDGALFYHVEPRCGSLPCPPYVNTKEMKSTWKVHNPRVIILLMCS